MSEAYWVAGSEYLFPAEENSSGSQLQKAGEVFVKTLAEGCIKPAWVDEIQWVSGTASRSVLLEALAANGFPGNVPFFTWEQQAGLDHYLVQATIRAIVCGDLQIACMGELDARSISGMCLASHTAVGRYNLAPAACMAGRFSLRASEKSQPPDHLKVLQSEIEKREIDAGEVSCIAIDGYEDVEAKNLRTLFPRATLLPSGAESPPGAVYRINTLAKTLGKSKGRFGLYIRVLEFFPAMVTLIEKV